MNTGSLAQKLNTIKTLAGTLGLAAAVETVLPGASLAEVERQLAALGKPRKATHRGTTRRVTSRTAQVRAQARALSELVSRANELADEAIDA